MTKINAEGVTAERTEFGYVRLVSDDDFSGRDITLESGEEQAIRLLFDAEIQENAKPAAQEAEPPAGFVKWSAKPPQIEAIQWDGTEAAAQAIKDRFPGATLSVSYGTRELMVFYRETRVGIAPLGYWVEILEDPMKIYARSPEFMAERYDFLG